MVSSLSWALGICSEVGSVPTRKGWRWLRLHHGFCTLPSSNTTSRTTSLSPLTNHSTTQKKTDQSSIQRRTRRIISRPAEARATRGYRTRANTADTPSRRDLTIHTTVAGMCGQEGDYTDDYNNYPATIYLNESFPRSDEGY